MKLERIETVLKVRNTNVLLCAASVELRIRAEGKIGQYMMPVM